MIKKYRISTVFVAAFAPVAAHANDDAAAWGGASLQAGVNYKVNYASGAERNFHSNLFNYLISCF